MSRLMQGVVKIGEHCSASFAEGLVSEDLPCDSDDLLGTGGTDEAGQGEDVGDVALAGGADLHG